MTELIDEPAREQIRLSNTQSLFVEAGAGTGKTREMVERITNIINSGAATIDQIVAITFTDASAGELRERIRQRLDVETSNSRFQMALANLEDAPIQTIHSFAQRIVARFATELGVPPDFEVRDRVDSQLAHDQNWLRYLIGLMSDDDDADRVQLELLGTALELGLNMLQFRQLTDALDRQWHLLTPYAERHISPAPRIDASGLLSLLNKATANASYCTKADSLIKTLDEVQGWLPELATAVENDSLDDVSRVLTQVKIPKGKGNEKNWPRDVLYETRELLTDAMALQAELLDVPRQWVLDGLRTLLCRHVLAEAAKRRAEGKLEFHDLLVYAVELARKPHIAEYLRSQYRFICIDEFQDTDALQVELAQLICDGGDTSPLLFTVGDAKQSIYRFRGADLEQFHKVRNVGVAQTVGLETNFRSVNTVVDWVNPTFETLMAEQFTNAWVSLATAREDAHGTVTVIGGEVEDKRAREIREFEAAGVVAEITRAKQDGWCVVDDDKSNRPIRYSDMAILMPTRRSLPALERALRAENIPFRVESRSLIWNTQEIRDVAAILRSASNPRDEVALVAALRTPSFACSDSDLLAWHQSGGKWNYSEDFPEDRLESSVAQAFEQLRSLNQKQLWMPVSQFVADLIGELGMFELAYARERRREAWHRLRFIIDRARAWTEAGGFGLQSFVQWVDTQTESAADALESVVPEADDDSVRIMTIHASKGLEFPFVALVGLAATAPNTDSGRVLWGSDGSCELRIGNKVVAWQTPGFETLSDLDTVANRNEELRLLYVGVTRAKDHLVVSTFRGTKGNAKNSLAARLAEGMAEVPECHPVSVAASTASREPAADNAETFEQRRYRRANAIAKGSRQMSMSATGIATEYTNTSTHLPTVTVGSQDLDAIELAERLSFGSAVHAALELIDIDELASINRLASVMSEKFELPHRRDDIRRSIELALQTPLIREAFASGRVWREVPVLADTGELVIGGSVDLMWQRDDGLVIVDYKTEDVPDAEHEAAALERYKWQLATYALACARTTGLPVSDACLLFIPPGATESKSIHIEPVAEVTEQLLGEVIPSLL